MLESLASLDATLAQYEHIAWAFFSLFGFFAAITAIIYRIKTIFDGSVQRAAEQIKKEYRQDHQGAFFDIQEERYDNLLDRYVELHKLICDIELRLKDSD